MTEDILRFNGTREWDPDIDQWLADQQAELGTIALGWFSRMRECGEDVRELMHDGCPVACVSDAPFAYVNVFKAHVNVGFFHGASLADASDLLEGSGKRMRHVKLKPGKEIDEAALQQLVTDAYNDIQKRV